MDDKELYDPFVEEPIDRDVIETLVSVFCKSLQEDADREPLLAMFGEETEMTQEDMDAIEAVKREMATPFSGKVEDL